MKGTPVNKSGNKRVYDFGKVIGPNGETKVKAHMDDDGNIHGHPQQ